MRANKNKALKHLGEWFAFGVQSFVIAINVLFNSKIYTQIPYLSQTLSIFAIK